MKSQSITRKRLAELSGVNPETIRFYEGRGLLPEPERSASGYRQYGEADVRRLAFVRRAQDLGFTLNEIAELLSLQAAPRQSSRKVKFLAEAKIVEIASKIRDLKRMKTALQKIAMRCDGSAAIHSCPILHAIDHSLS